MAGSEFKDLVLGGLWFEHLGGLRGQGLPFKDLGGFRGWPSLPSSIFGGLGGWRFRLLRFKGGWVKVSNLSLKPLNLNCQGLRVWWWRLRVSRRVDALMLEEAGAEILCREAKPQTINPWR